MEEAATTSSTKLCRICNMNDSRYTCPRCGIAYCNIDCYKSEAHLDCSESFYKQCVEEELSSRANDIDSERKMMEILQRLHEQDLGDCMMEDDDIQFEFHNFIDSDDDDEVPDLTQRLTNININNASEIWSALTSAERQEFEASVVNGEAEKWLPPWIPWWSNNSKGLLIQEMDEAGEPEYIKECPKILDVPILNELEKASPNIRYNIANVIYAYAYTVLHLNGEHLDSPLEAVSIFLNIADNARENKVFMDFDSAINSTLQRIYDDSNIPSDEGTIFAVKEAGMAIISGPEKQNSSFYMSSALSDLHSLISKAKDELSNLKTKPPEKNMLKKLQVDCKGLEKTQLKLLLKKIEYYLSWVKGCGQRMYD